MLATEDPLKMPTNLARDCLSESPFLAVEESLSQRLYNIWYDCVCIETKLIEGASHTADCREV